MRWERETAHRKLIDRTEKLTLEMMALDLCRVHAAQLLPSGRPNGRTSADARQATTALRPPRQRLVQVSGFQHPKTANVLLCARDISASRGIMLSRKWRHPRISSLCALRSSLQRQKKNQNQIPINFISVSFFGHFS